MMKDDELWLKKIKERLDDYSEPLPDAGWERLEDVYKRQLHTICYYRRKLIGQANTVEQDEWHINVL